MTWRARPHAGDYERDGRSGLLLPRHARRSIERAHPQFVCGPMFFGGGDLYWANVALLMHMDGANGSVTFTDEKGNSTSAVGNAQISTAQSKFGGASALFDGSGDAISVTHSSNFDVAGSAFTLEGFVRFSVAAGSGRYDALISKRQNDASTPIWMQVYRNGASGSIGKLTFNAADSAGSTWDVALHSTTTLDSGSWYYWAITRSGSTWRLFINGTQEASTTSSITVAINTQPITFGGAGTDIGAPFSGYLDEVRITKGVARYTADFTTPSAPFPNS